MKPRIRISLFFKLFFVFGFTFESIIAILSESIQKPFQVDDIGIIAGQLGLCLLIVIVSALIVRHLLKPLTEMNQLSGEFSHGRFAKRVSLLPNDELGELGQAMNSMADRIQAQMDSLKHLAVGVSHEIRSPLARMRLAVEMLPEAEAKSVLVEQIQELDQITGAILDREALNSGLSELKLEEVDLHELLVEMCAHYAKMGQDLRVEVDKTPPIRGDRRRLEMCLKNLLDNALKYGEGVHVELRSGVIAISNRDLGAKRAGFGLGVLLSESIVKAHGGEFAMSKNEDRITVRLTLPG